MSEEVTLINGFEVPPGGMDDAIRTWERVRDFLRDQPGYIDTALHRATDPEARFQLVNVARWESEDCFRAAIARLQQAGGPPRRDGLVASPALYTVIRRTRS